MARDDAVETALRALRHRDRSTAELAARLERRGLDESACIDALETLTRIGFVDDERFARARAEQLAARNAGNRLIRHDLTERGVDGELIEAALAALDSERERASRVVARRGRGVRTARYLAARGFEDDAVEAAVALDD